MAIGFNLKYEFFVLILIAVTSALVLFGMLFLFAAFVKLIGITLKHIRTDLMYTIFVCQILIGLLIVAQICVYTTMDLVDLVTEVVLSTTDVRAAAKLWPCVTDYANGCIDLFVFYMFQKECLMFFTNKYLLETPTVMNRLVLDQQHKKLMFADKHPMAHKRGFERMRLVDLYTRYSYLLAGHAVVCNCRHRRMSTYEDARVMNRKNNTYITIYLFSIPVLLTAKFIVDQYVGLENLKVGQIKLAGLFKLAEFIITFSVLPRIISFASSFIEIFAFFESNKQIICIFGLKIFRKLLQVILNFIPAEISTYSHKETTSLLEASIYSLLYFLFCYLTFKRFNPETLLSYEHTTKDVTLRDSVKSKFLAIGDEDTITTTTDNSSIL